MALSAKSAYLVEVDRGAVVVVGEEVEMAHTDPGRTSAVLFYTK